MASRMDRYYKDELVEPERSYKNKSLYEQIENLDTYSNIEGVATIEKTNEIDISKVKEMINNRENYKKQKQFKNLLKEEKKELEKEEIIEEETKNYDIKDILSKVREDDSKNRRLDKEYYDSLKKLSRSEKKYDIEKEENELKELINTISGTKLIEKTKSLDNDDVGLLDELKSDTMVGTASSIKKIINLEKEKEQEATQMQIDKSFYTSSLGFTQRDFEELKDMNHKLKKSNKYIIILLIILITLFIVGITFFILK